MDTQNCKTCCYAEWTKAKSGRLAPSGGGHCTYKVLIVIPKAYYFIGSLTPSGGYMNRKNPLTNCPTWKQKEAKNDPTNKWYARIKV